MIGYAFCGSFCTHAQSLEELKKLKNQGYDILPIMSENVYTTSTRFGSAEDFIKKVEQTTGREVIHTIVDAEPLGPKIALDALLIAPCTGNTLAKIARGITDTAVTMAIKAHLRNNKPVVLGIATNDALGGSAKNIGLLHNTKNIYFVPYRQDDPQGKNNSLICDFSLIEKTVEEALKGKQLQPIII
jgi:dipicolinate synthase subunit B